MNDGYAKHSPIEFSASFANTKEIAKLIVDKLQTLHPNYNPIHLFLKWITDPKTDHSVFPPRFLDDDFEEMWSIFSQTEGISKEIEVKERLKKIFPDNKDELIDILSTAFFKNQSTEVKYFATEVSGLAAASMDTYHLKNKVLDMGAVISTYEEKVATLERQAINNNAAFEAVKNVKDAKIAELERIILELKLALAVPVIVTGDIDPCTPKEPLFDAKKSYEHLKALVTLQETRLQKLEKCQNCTSPKPVDEAPPEKQDTTTHKKHKPPVYGELELTIKDMIVKYFIAIKQDYVPLTDFRKCYQAILVKTNCEPRHIDFTMGKMTNEFILTITDGHVVYLNRGLEISILKQLVLVMTNSAAALPEGELITMLCSRTSHCSIVVGSFINVWLRKGFISLHREGENRTRIINCTRLSMIEDYIKQ